MSGFLLEIYSEEIPAKLQFDASKGIKKVFENHFIEINISFSDISVDISACRIAIYSKNLALTQKTSILRGPVVNSSDIAIDGFLKKNNIKNKLLLKEIDGYYFYQKNYDNHNIESIIALELPKILDKCQFVWSRRMSWNNSKKEWIRPIRNLLCIFNKKVIPFQYAGLIANNISFGNKNITKKAKIIITSLNDYFDKLKNNYVILKYDDRISIILSSLRESETKFNIDFKIDKSRDLIKEVCGLSEYPILVLGIIPEMFLNIPSCIIEQKIKNDQKCFVSYKNNELAPLIGIFVECLNDKINHILKGNMRVINARITDADFFYKKDIQLFFQNNPKDKDSIKKLLSNIPIGEKLGTLWDKVVRIKEIMQNLCKIGGKDILGGLDLDIIADYMKLDMVTNAYKEFPELQGFIGSEYATRIWNLPSEYSDVFAAQHGINVGYGEHVSAIANAIEYVASHLHIGTEFTSSSDPFMIERYINFIASIYEWIPNLGIHQSAIRNLLPEQFKNIDKKLSEILIKFAKKGNIKRLKEKFKDYSHIMEICNHYFDQDVSYFRSQVLIKDALDWINIEEEHKIVIKIYKRCKNIDSENSNQEVEKITISETEEINDMIDRLNLAVSSNNGYSNVSKLHWDALFVDLERYFNNHKISNSSSRIKFIKSIKDRIDTRYPFLKVCDIN